EREEERLKKRQEFKQEMLKQGEHAQWRLDSQNRETIEKWEKEERDRWEAEVFRSFDEETGALLPDTEPTIEDITEEDRADDVREAPAAKVPESTPKESKPAESPTLLVKANDQPIWKEEELEETEEYVPDVRDNPGKIGIRFTMRPRPGVPVRDRGRKAPPFPKDAPKTDAPPMIAGDEEDESDPVWLKDKGDKLMTLGDYQGAYNAYTEALKLASNARCFANRAVAALYLGNFEQCLEDCNRSIQILDFRNKPRPGEMSHTADPEDEKVRARVEVRMGVAYLWLGAFQKAEAHFEKALGSEGLELEESKQVRLDLQRVQAAKKALQEKEQADQTLRGATGDEKEVLDKALQLYSDADATSQQ
ncbi:DNAAF4, partial [Symbiodinium pilosum]